MAMTVDACKVFFAGKSAKKSSLRRKTVTRMGESCRFYAAEKIL